MNERAILSKMYFDKADVYRISDIEDDDGITRQSRQKVYEDIKCSLSQKTMSSLNPDTNTNTLTMKHIPARFEREFSVWFTEKMREN